MLKTFLSSAAWRTYGSQLAICLVHEQSAKLYGVLRLFLGQFLFKAEGEDIRRTDESASSAQTHMRHFSATRDYAKISRASTDATGASLTIVECEMVKLLWRIIFGGGERKK